MGLIDGVRLDRRERVHAVRGRVHARGRKRLLHGTLGRSQRAREMPHWTGAVHLLSALVCCRLVPNGMRAVLQWPRIASLLDSASGSVSSPTLPWARSPGYEPRSGRSLLDRHDSAVLPHVRAEAYACALQFAAVFVEGVAIVGVRSPADFSEA